MNAFRLTAVATALALLAACAPQRKPPPAPPPPAPRPVATSMPAPAPPPDWRDAPATPGAWSYRSGALGTWATFAAAAGEPLFALNCDRSAGRVVLQRRGSATREVLLTVVTTTLSRAFNVAPPLAGPSQQLAVSLVPRDPLLDAIAFSRGRFMVEVPGTATLYLPAWPEVARVVEDCR